MFSSHDRRLGATVLPSRRERVLDTVLMAVRDGPAACRFIPTKGTQYGSERVALIEKHIYGARVIATAAITDYVEAVNNRSCRLIPPQWHQSRAVQVSHTSRKRGDR
jgi:hypothetical protein